jgi:integrase
MKYRQDYCLYRRKMKNSVAVWYYRTYDEYGQRTTGRSTGQTNKTLARRYCNQLMRRGKLVPIRDVSFNNYSTDWWLWERCSYIRSRLARSPSNKPAISRNYAREMHSILEQYLIPTFGRLRLSSITPRIIESWMFGLLDKGLSPKRINNICSCLRVMLKEAQRLGQLRVNPFETVRPLADNCRERGVFTIDEVKALFDPNNIAPVWNGHSLYRVINMVAAATGMRQGEILAVRDEDLRNGSIHVSHSWDPRYGLGPTKTRQERDVPVPSRVLEDMQLFVGTGGFIFSFTQGKSPATGNRVTRALYVALERIGISEKERDRRNLTFHSWRHFFNSVMRSRSIPDPLLQRVTGHATTEMTERYTHFNLEDFREIASVQAEVFK